MARWSARRWRRRRPLDLGVPPWWAPQSEVEPHKDFSVQSPLRRHVCGRTILRVTVQGSAGCGPPERRDAGSLLHMRRLLISCISQPRNLSAFK
ncbi:unnamed protein product, partial [Iphiclides podalirius]